MTYGAPSFAIGGASLANLDTGLGQLQSSLVDAGSTLEFAVLVVHPITLGAMALMRGSGGAPAYPAINVKTGGNIGGIPVISSASVPRAGSPLSTSIVMLDASRIWIADDGDLRFDTSKFAALEMLLAPSGDASTGTGAQQTSMFQTDSIALRGARSLNFAAASGAAAVLTGVGF